MHWEILIAAILLVGVSITIKEALYNRASRKAPSGKATGERQRVTKSKK